MVENLGLDEGAIIVGEERNWKMILSRWGDWGATELAALRR